MLSRGFDLAVSAVGLLLLAVPLLVVGLAVKLGSEGPVFFVQRRVGRHGRPFGLVKFRTMTAGGSGPAVTALGDPRITAVGRVLRRTKVDELPQLWNILKGDMGIIGPRPEVERFVLHYTDEQRRILDARPGLACMAQLVFADEAAVLAGHPDPEAAYVRDWMPRKLAADLEYVRRRTFLSDLGLLLRLAGLVVFGRPRQTSRLR